jgi:hypothetical protein
MQREEEDRLMQASAEGGSQDGYPIAIRMPDGKYLKVESDGVFTRTDQESLVRQFHFAFSAQYFLPHEDEEDGRRKSSRRKSRRKQKMRAERFEEWTFSATYSQFKFLAKLLNKPKPGQEQLPEAAREFVPAWPSDAPKNSNKVALADERLPIIKGWMLALLNAAPELPELFELKAVRRFMNLPLDAAQLGSEIAGGNDVAPLTLEQMTNVQNLVDEMVAQAHGGIPMKRETKQLLTDIMSSIMVTCNPTEVLGDDRFEAYSDDDKNELVAMAMQTVDSLEQIQFTG